MEAGVGGGGVMEAGASGGGGGSGGRREWRQQRAQAAAVVGAGSGGSSSGGYKRCHARRKRPRGTGLPTAAQGVPGAGGGRAWGCRRRLTARAQAASSDTAAHGYPSTMPVQLSMPPSIVIWS